MMTYEKFEEHINALLGDAKVALFQRGADYAPEGDPVENFRRTYMALTAIGITNIGSARDVARFFIVTKLVREATKARTGKDYDRSARDSRLDALNYLLILDALCAEEAEYDKKVQEYQDALLEVQKPKRALIENCTCEETPKRSGI